MSLKPRHVDCTECGGSGYKYKGKTCPDCHGRGWVDGIFGEKTCRRCAGTREVSYQVECTKCKGKGYTIKMERWCDRCKKWAKKCRCSKDSDHDDWPR